MDRNLKTLSDGFGVILSLSARRAWIEIVTLHYAVDYTLSLSARRAWIEIFDVQRLPEPSTRRSPQGERG